MQTRTIQEDISHGEAGLQPDLAGLLGGGAHNCMIEGSGRGIQKDCCALCLPAGVPCSLQAAVHLQHVLRACLCSQASTRSSACPVLFTAAGILFWTLYDSDGSSSRHYSCQKWHACSAAKPNSRLCSLVRHCLIDSIPPDFAMHTPTKGLKSACLLCCAAHSWALPRHAVPPHPPAQQYPADHCSCAAARCQATGRGVPRCPGGRS